MLISFFRTLILFVFVIFAVRLMGKRQVGQLQPAELVITILLSEIAATPMQDNDIPMLNSIAAILILISLEIIMSAISLKSMKFRSVLQGNSVVIIKDGVIQQDEMKRLRFTLDDLLEALRGKDVFDISEVAFAVAETNGSLSVLLKDKKQCVTKEDMNVPENKNGMPVVVIMDGKYVSSPLPDFPLTKKKIEGIIKKEGITADDIFLMSVDKCGKSLIIEREKNE